MKPKVMYVLRQYPQISETYVQTEIDAVSDEFEVIVIAIQDSKKNGNTPYRNHNPYLALNDINQIGNAIEMFKPTVLHTHWLLSLPVVHALAKHFELPFTVRAHSFDTIPSEGPRLAEWRQTAPKVIPRAVNDPLCLGVLAFPFSRPYLRDHGADLNKVIDCFPCADFNRFYNREPNGRGIMNIGACIPKKRMEEFLELGKAMPDRDFTIYPVSYDTDKLAATNQAMGSPVTIHEPVEPDQMPTHYKQNEWMVYTADRQMSAIGWPLSIAEAQAAGVGVLLPDVRPDIADYLGGSGYTYSNLEEVREIIASPVPAALREHGFENARKSDVYEHKSKLTGLWRTVTG